MDVFLEILKYLNLPAVVIVLFGVGWLMRDFKKEMRGEMTQFRQEMKSMREDMYKEFKFFNIRLSRVEGTTYGKDIYKPSLSEESQNV
jgi:hypothetical protein